MMDRTQKVQTKLWLDQLADLATEQSKLLSAELGAEAQAEYEANRTLPSWRIPDLATVASKATHEAAVVVNPAVFTDWVAKRFPDQVETVQRVYEGWQRAYLKRVTIDGNSAADPKTGEIVPGVQVKTGGVFMGVSVTPTPAAKELFAQLAAASLHRLALDASPAVTLELTGGEVEQ